MMSFPRPIQWHNSHADLIWPDDTLKEKVISPLYLYSLPWPESTQAKKRICSKTTIALADNMLILQYL